MAETNADIEEIWALVAQEGGENLTLAEEALLKLEASPANSSQIAGLFRALHTFKGAVRMMGLTNTEALAHSAEDLVALARDKGVALGAEMIDLLLHVLDRLQTVLKHIVMHRADVAPSQVAELSAQLREMVSRQERLLSGEETTAPQTGSQTAPRLDLPKEIVQTMKALAPLEPAGETKTLEPPLAGHDLSSEVDLPAAGSHALGMPFEGQIFEPLDLTADAEYVHIFLDLARDELSRLHQAHERLTAGPPGMGGAADESLEQVRAAAEALQIAAERMGYSQLLSALAEILALARSAETALETTASPANGEALIRLRSQFYALEQALQAELEQIEKTVFPIRAAETKPFLLTDLFRQWNARYVETDLEQLEAVIAALDQETQQLVTGSAQRHTALADELTGLLRDIYHVCVFYHLDQAAHLTLALEDLSVRIQRDEILISRTILGLFDAYVMQLREAMRVIASGQTPDLLAFEMLVSLTWQVVDLAPGNAVLRVARAVVEALDLSPAFQSVLTPENLAEVSQALQAQQYFYTILADLEDNEALGRAFWQWTQSGNVTPITNIPVDGDAGSRVNFLVTSSLKPEALREALKQIDPQGQYLTLTECTLPSTNNPVQPPTAFFHGERDRQGDLGAAAGVGVPAETLSELVEMVGELVADQSTLHGLVARLMETSLFKAGLERASSVAGMRAGGAVADVKTDTGHDLETYENNWTETVSALAQIEGKLSTTLAGLQERTGALGLRPAAEILEPLRRTAQILALRQGKQVALDWKGTDLELDGRLLKMAAEPLRQLVCYCVAEDLEPVEQRRAAGKAVRGRLTIIVTQAGNHILLTIEDDGYGQLAGLDLIALQTELRACQGKLMAFSEAGRGLRFTLTLPLELAVVDGMVVRVGDICYVVPVQAIQRILQPEMVDWVGVAADGVGRMLKIEGRVLPVRSLLAATPQPANQNGQRPHLLVVVDKEPQPVALEVDELIGRQSVLVRPLPGYLAGMRSASGCALLGEGKVGVVLNLDML